MEHENEKTYVIVSPQPEVENHALICAELNALFARKNKDYGDSFHKTFLEEGMAMARIRMSDKLERFKTLTKNGRQYSGDESVRDTVIDLANYAIMTVMEIDRLNQSQRSGNVFEEFARTLSSVSQGVIHDAKKEETLE